MQKNWQNLYSPFTEQDLKIMQKELARAKSEQPFFARFNRYRKYTDDDLLQFEEVVSQTQKKMKVRCFGYTTEAAYFAFLSLRNALETMTDQAKWSLRRHKVQKYTVHAHANFARALRRWLHHSGLVKIEINDNKMQINWPHQQLHKRYQDHFLQKYATSTAYAGIVQIDYNLPKYTYHIHATTPEQLHYIIDMIYHIYTIQYHRPRRDTDPTPLPIQ
jgi:hypothetical protein